MLNLKFTTSDILVNVPEKIIITSECPSELLCTEESFLEFLLDFDISHIIKSYIRFGEGRGIKLSLLNLYVYYVSFRLQEKHYSKRA